MVSFYLMSFKYYEHLGSVKLQNYYLIILVFQALWLFTLKQIIKLSTVLSNDLDMSCVHVALYIAVNVIHLNERLVS